MAEDGRCTKQIYRIFKIMKVKNGNQWLKTIEQDMQENGVTDDLT